MTDVPTPQQRRQQAVQLAGDYLRRIESGEDLSVSAFCEEHPELEPELREELGKNVGTIHFNSGDQETDPPASRPAETQTFDPTSSFHETVDLGRRQDFSVSDVAHELKQSTEPKNFGEYELLEVIGRGGMGVVCKAKQRSIDRVVALKMIRDGQLASAGDVERFYTEAQAAGSLTHPNIVTVHEAGVYEGHHFYSMEFIEGEDLGHRIKRGDFAAEEIAPTMVTIAKAVHYAHSKGVLHRDLKPANVLIDQHGHPLVTDFGLARIEGRNNNLTASGAPMGTPGYMPPEQAEGKVEDFGPPGDVYSLGAVLYSMLTGEPPFQAESLADIIMKVLHKEPVPPSSINRSANRDLETICLKCLQKDPKKRYATAMELAEDLQRVIDGKPIVARRATVPQKAWYWLRDVPLVAALAGRRVTHPTPIHKLVQWMFLIVAALTVGTIIARQMHTPGMPDQVRILAGHREGKYHAVATDMANSIEARVERPGTALETTGSVENHRRLLNREAEMALIQAESLESNKLAVAAPMYYEFVLVIVRRSAAENKQIHKIEDLAKANVALGPPGSGMRLSAVHLLQLFGIDGGKLAKNESNFLALLDDPALDAAIIVSGLSNPGVRRVLSTGAFDLLPIPDAERVAMRIPSFHAGHVFPEQLPAEFASRIDKQGLATLFTPAYLVVRRDAPDILVRETLATLYDTDAGLVEKHDLLPLSDAASWRAIPRHPAAEAFFSERMNEFVDSLE